MKSSDLEILEILLALPEPHRDDLFEFLGAKPKSETEVEVALKQLNASLALKNAKPGSKPN